MSDDATHGESVTVLITIDARAIQESLRQMRRTHRPAPRLPNPAGAMECGCWPERDHQCLQHRAIDRLKSIIRALMRSNRKGE